MVIVGPEGLTRERYAPERPHAQCVFEHVYFSRPDSIVFGRAGAGIARDAGPAAGARAPRRRRYRGAGAGLGRRRRPRLRRRIAASRSATALIRNHYVGRTFIEPSQAIRDFGVKLKLNPVRYLLEGKRVVLVDDSIVRGTTSRKIVRMVRQAGAREVHMRISCPPTDLAVLLRRGYADQERADRRQQHRGGDPALRRRRHAWGICRSRRCAKPSATTSGTNTATPATRATTPPNWSTSKS